MQLEVESPAAVGREGDALGTAGHELAGDLVAVQVQFVGLVAGDLQPHPLALAQHQQLGAGGDAIGDTPARPGPRGDRGRCAVSRSSLACLQRTLPHLQVDLGGAVQRAQRLVATFDAHFLDPVGDQAVVRLAIAVGVIEAFAGTLLVEAHRLQLAELATPVGTGEQGERVLHRLHVVAGARTGLRAHAVGVGTEAESEGMLRAGGGMGLASLQEAADKALAGALVVVDQTAEVEDVARLRHGDAAMAAMGRGQRVVARLGHLDDFALHLQLEVVEVDDHAVVHHLADGIAAQRGHAARVALRLVRLVDRQRAAGELAQQRSDGVIAVEQLRHRGHDGAGAVVVVVLRAVVGLPEAAGVEAVAEVEHQPVEDAVATQGIVEFVHREQLTDADRVQHGQLLVDALLAAARGLARHQRNVRQRNAGQVGQQTVADLAVEQVRDFHPQHHRQLALGDHLARFGRRGDETEPALARATLLGVNVVLQRTHHLGLLVDRVHFIAVVRLQLEQGVDRAQHLVLHQLVDHDAQTGLPGAFYPLVVHALVGQRMRSRPAGEGRPALVVVLAQRVVAVEVADQVEAAAGTVDVLAVLERVSDTETVERRAVLGAAEEVGGADVHVGIGEAQHLAIAGAAEGLALGVDGDFRIRRATLGEREAEHRRLVGEHQGTALRSHGQRLAGSQLEREPALPGSLHDPVAAVGRRRGRADLAADGGHQAAVTRHDQVAAERGRLHEQGFGARRGGGIGGVAAVLGLGDVAGVGGLHDIAVIGHVVAGQRLHPRLAFAAVAAVIRTETACQGQRQQRQDEPRKATAVRMDSHGYTSLFLFFWGRACAAAPGGAPTPAACTGQCADHARPSAGHRRTSGTRRGGLRGQPRPAARAATWRILASFAVHHPGPSRAAPEPLHVLRRSRPASRTAARSRGDRLHHSDAHPAAGHSGRALRPRPARRSADRHRQDRRLHAAPAAAPEHAETAAPGPARAHPRTGADPHARARGADRAGGEQQAQQQPGQARTLAGMRVMPGTAGVARQARQVRERGPEGNVDARLGVHRPAVGIENGRQVALAQLEPGQHHRRPGDQQHDGQQHQRQLPPGQAKQAADHRRQRRADGTQRQPDGREDADELADVEGRSPRCRRRRTGRDLLRCPRHPGRCLVIDRLLLGGGELLRLLGDHASDAPVRRPEGIAQAHRVLHDARDGGVPVIALAVVEHAVAPGHEIAGTTGGDRRHDGHGGLAVILAAAVAVQQIAARERGQRGVARGIIDLHAKVEAATVEEQRAGLEHRLAAAVEVAESHEVVEQRHQVALVAHQPVGIQRGVGLGGHGQVGGDQCLQAGAGIAAVRVAGQVLPQPLLGHRLQRSLGLAAQPRQVRAEALAQHPPVRQRQAFARPQQRRHHMRAETSQGIGPGRVHAVAQRQLAAGAHLRQRHAQRLGVAGMQGLRRQLPELGLGTVHEGGGTGIVGGELTAHEEVLDLLRHRFVALDGRHRGIPLGQAGDRCATRIRDDGRRCQAACPPRLQRLGLGEEAIDQCLGDRGRTAAVGLAAQAGDDVLDQRLQTRIVAERGRHQAIAVGLADREQQREIVGVGGGQAVGVGTTEVAQDVTRRSQQAGAFGGVGADRRQRQAGAGEQHFGIGQVIECPAHRGQHFGHTDTTVSVTVDVAQGAGIELQTLHRAGQAGPELEVELAERAQVVDGLDADLVETAGAEEAPAVRAGGRSVSHGHSGKSGCHRTGGLARHGASTRMAGGGATLYSRSVISIEKLLRSQPCGRRLV
ncbi:UNVERIFIED_CONTAM: hypothetical protein NCL1_03576 [Trichonephila clavipes]